MLDTGAALAVTVMVIADTVLAIHWEAKAPAKLTVTVVGVHEDAELEIVVLACKVLCCKVLAILSISIRKCISDPFQLQGKTGEAEV